jgi:hypothetical protein
MTGVAGITGMRMTSNAIAFWTKESVWIKRNMYDTACPVGCVTPCTSGHVISDGGHLAYIQPDNRVGVITNRITLLTASCDTLHWISGDLLLVDGCAMTVVNGESIISGTPTARYLPLQAE